MPPLAPVLLLLCVAQVHLQSLDDQFNSKCTAAQSCGECLRKGPQCSWCKLEEFKRGEPRCDIEANLKQRCSGNIENPKSTQNVTQYLKDTAYTSGDKQTPPVQVKPQKMHFSIRPNDPQKFKLSFMQQENYPADLYFLLDITYGMKREDDEDANKTITTARDILIKLGSEIPREMQDITNNFRLGFGTFVDKTVMPYSTWTDTMLENRCPTKDCSKPHLYQHQQALGNNPDEFKNKMTAAMRRISLSLDDTEGGMEGLVQALDCDVVGWRDVSRRIIVYSSNSQFHLAGAGKFGGATKQNKLTCSLDSKGLLEDNVYDYPSVSQIASKMKEKNANVIFAVTKLVTKHYQKLLGFLPGSAVGELAEDSANIIQLIKEKYNELRSTIEFQPDNSDVAKFEFSSKCLSDKEQLTTKCTDLEIGTKVDFEVTMTVKEDVCKDQQGIVQKNVAVRAVGLNEMLNITLDIMCECQCELPPVKPEEIEKQQELNLKCSGGNGTMECGTCSCNTGRYGLHCECDENDISNAVADEQCKQTNTSEICSGNGECICGVCKCDEINADKPNERYSKQFCQCDDFNCVKADNGLVCGGSEQGFCNCGNCNCTDDFEHTAEKNDCGCPKSKETCKARDGKICNGKGDCVCGKCKCRDNMSGPTCEDCDGCSRCEEYVDCAQCVGFGTGRLELKENCDKECNSNFQRTIKNDQLQTGKGIRQCKGVDVDKCEFFFTYRYTESNDVRIEVQTTKKCPEDAPVMAIVGGIVAAVVLGGLLIIFLLVFIRNRRDAKEFADFMKERDRAKWESGANPIYKDPKTTFQNPTYRGGK